jgi:hypothetical protein
MRWMGHVALMREMRNVYKIMVEDHSEDLGVFGLNILK